MRKIYTLFILCYFFVNLSVFAQEGGISIGKGKNPAHAKAILELFSEGKGLLTPRLTTAQRIGMFESVDETAEGMLVFDTDNNTFFFWDGSKWVEVSESTSSDPLNYADPNDPNGDGKFREDITPLVLKKPIFSNKKSRRCAYINLKKAHEHLSKH
ncbi:hypothetical protein QUH73_20215 [Labilibaculum sp. K2S]|uniref:hypothetical protein n=1 Tax=Labilibaculum sp. K2S TaxID=3056386 RepID=UPI0025A45B64|nr:hypothetical protein [Labilibaculum sp. K2S]MDM8162155.1 hypothetical protein [Labilibaculum sp. K2S]